MKCKNCNAQNKPTALFCTSCGFSMEDHIFCLQCGSVIDISEKYCSKCGNENANSINEFRSEEKIEIDPKINSIDGNKVFKTKEKVDSEFNILRKSIIFIILLIISISSFLSISKFDMYDSDNDLFTYETTYLHKEYNIGQNGFKYFDTLRAVIFDSNFQYSIYKQKVIANHVYTEYGFEGSSNDQTESKLSTANFLLINEGNMYNDQLPMSIYLIIQCLIILAYILLPVIFIIKIIKTFIKDKDINNLQVVKYFTFLFCLSFILSFSILKIGDFNTYIGTGLILYMLFSVLGICSIGVLNLIERSTQTNKDEKSIQELSSKSIYNGLNVVFSLVILICLLSSFVVFSYDNSPVENYLTDPIIGESSVSINDISVIFMDGNKVGAYRIQGIQNILSDYTSGSISNAPWEYLFAVNVYESSIIDTVLIYITYIIGLVTIILSLILFAIQTDHFDQGVLYKRRILLTVRAIFIFALLGCAIAICVFYNFDVSFSANFECRLGIGIVIASIISILNIPFNMYFERNRIDIKEY